MKEKLQYILIIFGIAILVNLSWNFLELIIYGTIQPRIVDAIIGGILTGSLYRNFKTWTNQ